MRGNNRVRKTLIAAITLVMCIFLLCQCLDNSFFDVNIISVHYASIALIAVPIVFDKKYAFVLAVSMFCLFNVLAIPALGCLATPVNGGSGGASLNAVVYIFIEPIQVFIGLSIGLYLDKTPD